MPKLRSTISALICLVGAGLIATSGAQANDPAAEAEQLITRGIQLRKNRDDQAAAREFQKAYKLVHSPRAAGQLGLAEQALGRWEDAERHVGEALRSGDDPWVVRNRTALDQSLATIQQHLGRLEITGDPEGAEVSVNGRPVGKLPLSEPVRVSAGQVDIDLRAPGFVAVQRTLTIVGGQYQPVVIHLAREQSATTAKPASSSPTETAVKVPPGAADSAPATAASAETDVQPGPSGARVALKWTAAGLAGAGVATAVIGYALYRHNVNQFDSSSRQCGIFMGKGYSMITNTPDVSCQSLLDTYKTDQKVAIAGTVSAGVFAAAWLALFLTEPSGASEQPQASRWPRCVATPGGVGVVCSGRF